MSWSAGTYREVLQNGLTLLVQREVSAPVVAIVTHVKAGYFDEPDDWVGISHVFEHMFFKGTSRRGPGEIASETQLLGGYLNAGTIYDKTVYYAVFPSDPDNLSQALDIQADALMNPLLDTDELARELEVIIQEAKRKLDTPPAVMRETLYEMLFKRHRIRRWRIGTEDGLRSLTASDVRAYHDTRYQPANTIVSIVGDLDPQTAISLASDVYLGWENSPFEVDRSPPEPQGKTANHRVLNGDIQVPMAAVAWRTVGAGHEDAPSLDIAAAVLGKGRGSWLHQNVRDPGLASEIGSTHYTPTEVGVFDISLQGEPDSIEAALARSRGLVARLTAKGPTDSDLVRIRSMIGVQWSRGFEFMDGRASALCEFEALGSYELIDDYFDALMLVGPKDVRRVAEQYLDFGCASALMYYPENSGPSSDWYGEIQSVSPEASSHPKLRASGTDPVSELSATGLSDAGHIDLGTVHALVRRKAGSGLAAVGIYFPWVPLREDAATGGVCSLVARSALRGAGSYNAEQLSVLAEGLGGPIRPAVASEFLGWETTVRGDQLNEALALLRTVAASPSLREDDVLTERGNQASDAARLRDDMYRYPVRRSLNLAFPGSAYGLPLLGEPEQLLSVEPGVVSHWAEDLLAIKPVVVVVGDLEVTEMVEAVVRQISWPATGEGEGGVLETRTPLWTPGSEWEERAKAQTAIAMAYPAVSFCEPDRYATVIVSKILGGMAGRLFHALREDRALAYTVTATPWMKRLAGAMFTYIATSPEREGEARDAMLQQLDLLAADEVAPDELLRACRYAAGLERIKMQSSLSVQGDLLTYWLNDAMGEFGQAGEKLLQVSAEDVQRVSRNIFVADRRAEFVVRGTVEQA